MGSLVPKEEYYHGGLYVFYIGENDISDLLFANLTVEQVNATIPDKVNAFATNITVYFTNSLIDPVCSRGL